MLRVSLKDYEHYEEVIRKIGTNNQKAIFEKSRSYNEEIMVEEFNIPRTY